MPGLAQVEEDVRVQVAVARVEDVGDGQAVVLADLADPAQHLGQAGAGHDAVVQVVVGPDATEGPDRALAAGPQQLALGGVGGRPQAAGLARAQDALDGLRQLGAALLHAVDLDQEHRPRVDRVAGPVVGLDGADGDPVHHLQGGRHDAVADDVGDRVAGGLDRGEGGHQRHHRLGQGDQHDLDPR